MVLQPLRRSRTRSRPARPLCRAADSGAHPAELRRHRRGPRRRHPRCGRTLPNGSLPTFPGCALIGLDRDPNALWIAGERLQPFGDRVMLVRTRYDGIERCWPKPVIGQTKWTGSSSTSACRRCNSTAPSGASPTAADAPLDMRMDPDAPLTAAEILNTFDEKALTRVAAGVRRGAFRRAASPANRPPTRPQRPFSTTAELVELLYQAIPAPARRTGGHPAKRTFQALRIAVNGELDSLRDAIPAALGALRWRPDRRDGLSVAGRPHRQERVRRRHRITYPARSAGRIARPRAGIRRPDPRSRAVRVPRRSNSTRVARPCGYGHWKRLSEGRLMKAKRPDTGSRWRRTHAAQPRTSQAPPGRSAAAQAQAGARTAPAALGAAHQPDPAAHRGPARPKNASQAKARAKARKAKAPKVVRPPLRERIARQAGLDRPGPARPGRQGAVRRAGDRVTRPRPRRHAVAVDRRRRAVLRLGHARETNQALLQQKEALERDVLEAQAAPALAEAARNLGMIPSRDTAHLVQDASGNWVVVGTPKPAQGVAPPPLNTPLPEDGPPAPPPPPAPRVVEPREVTVRVPPRAPLTTRLPCPASSARHRWRPQRHWPCVPVSRCRTPSCGRPRAAWPSGPPPVGPADMPAAACTMP